MKNKVYLYGTNDFINRYGKRLQAHDDIVIAGATNQETYALKEIVQSRSDFAIYHMDGSSSSLRVAQQIYMLFPQCINIAIANPDYLKNNIVALSQSGIHYSFSEEDNIDDVVEELNSIRTIEYNRMASLTGSSGLNASSMVYSFYGPKGGIGKSSVVVSTAIALTKLSKKVVILDFDLQFGDVATIAGIDNKETVAELLQEQANPTIETIRKYIVYHKTGINILCAPRNLEYSEKIVPEQIEKIISSLRSYYDYILIDLENNFNDILLSCCEQSNEVFVFTRADIATLKQTKQCLMLLDSLSQLEKVRLINCDIQKNARITKSDVSRVLAAEIWQTVPYDIYRTTDAINRGNPIIVDFPNSPVSKACEEIARKMTGVKGKMPKTEKPARSLRAPKTLKPTKAQATPRERGR